VTFANVCRRLEWKNYEVVVTTSKLINVSNVMNDAKEKLDFRDRVIKTSIGFKYMIVATSSQCYIYRYYVIKMCHHPSLIFAWGQAFCVPKICYWSVMSVNYDAAPSC